MPTRPRTIYDLALEQRQGVLDGEAKAIAEMKARWAVTRKELEAELDAMTRRIEAALAAGKTPGFGSSPQTFSKSWYYRVGRIARTLEAMERTVALAAGEEANEVHARAKAYAETAVGHARDLLAFRAGGATATNAATGAQFGRPSTKAFNNILAFSRPDGPIPKGFAAVGAEFVEELKGVIVTGLANGDNPRDVQRKLVGAATAAGAPLDAPLRRMELTARTEPFRAYREANRLTFKANSDVCTAWEWCAKLGPRTCAVCLAMDGTRHSLDTPMATHPQCRCTQTPVTAYTSERESGREYFHKLSAEEQDRILGSKAAGELYRRGELQLPDFVRPTDHPEWGKGRVTYSLKRMMGDGYVDKRLVADAANSNTPKALWKVEPPYRAPVNLPAVAPLAPVKATRVTSNFTGKAIPGTADEYAYDLAAHLAADDAAELFNAMEELAVAFPGADQATVAKNVLAFEQALLPAQRKRTAEVLKFKRVGAQAGSNTGGFYEGADGVKRYVKEYTEDSQAYCEHACNAVYEALGAVAPKSTLAASDRGGVLYASEILEGDTLAKVGLNKKNAKEALNGFVLDVLTANWDAAGLSLDNMFVLSTGKIARIDNGGSFLYRATNGRKSKSLLGQITEVQEFAPGGMNHSYASIFKAAGANGMDDIGNIYRKIQVVHVAVKNGTVRKAIEAATEGMDAGDRQAIFDMVEARAKLLDAERRRIGKAIEAAKKAKNAPPAPLGQTFLFDVDGNPDVTAIYEELRKEQRAITAGSYGANAQLKKLCRDRHVAAGGDGAAWDKVHAHFNSWTSGYKSSAPQMATYKVGKEMWVDNRITSDLAKALANVRDTRQRRYAQVMAARNLPAPTHQRIYRGTSGEEMVEHVLAQWSDPQYNGTLWAKVYESASWALRRGRPGRGEAAEGFYGYDTGAMFVADVPIENTLADQVLDDGTFSTTFWSEQEVIPLHGARNSVLCNGAETEVKIGGTRYRGDTQANRDAALAAFRAKYGRDPKPFVRRTVHTDHTNLNDPY